VVSLLAVALLPAGAAAATPKPRLAQATGRITALRASHITVGRLTCLVPTPGASVRRFAVGDRVAIVCRSRVLRSIKARERPATTPTVTTGATTTTTATTEPATTTAASGGGARITSPTITNSATGPIVALGESGITVGDVTCGFAPGFYAQISKEWHVGDVAYIGCGNGVVIVGPPG